MKCSDCSAQSCGGKSAKFEDIEWRLDYNKVFRLLAILSLLVAWYWGGQLHNPNWLNKLEELYPNAEIKPSNESHNLFSMMHKGELFYLSIATESSFGGPLTIVSVVDSSGKVFASEILSHKDTPAYIQRLKNKGFFRKLQGQPAELLPQKGRNWDVVSGATISSNAAMRANTRASHNIARDYFNKQPTPLKKKIELSAAHILLAIMILLSLLNIWLKNSRLKTAYTLLSVAVVGFMANQMISASNFSGLMLGYLPSLFENPGFWILFGSVISCILLLGRNIYCGHICPFHGLQYLLRKLGNLNFPLPILVLKYGQYLAKIGLWAALMVGFLTYNPSSGSYEPFSLVFSLQGEGIQWFIMPAVLIGCFFIPDMFCRFFCPAGEMMSLLTRQRNRLVFFIKQFFAKKEV